MSSGFFKKIGSSIVISGISCSTLSALASNYLSFSGDNNKDIMKFFSPFALNYGNFKGFLNAVLKDSKYNLNDEKVLEEFNKMQLHFVVRHPVEVPQDGGTGLKSNNIENINSLPYKLAMEQLGTSDYLHFSTGSEGIINDVLAKNKEDTFDSDISKELVENFLYIAQSFFKKRGVSLTFEELIKKLKVTETSEVNFLKNLLRDAFRLDSVEAFLYVLRQCIDLVSDGVSQFKEEDIVERLSSERLVNDCFRNPKEFIHTCIDVAIELSDKNGDMCNRRYFVQLKDKVDKTPNFAKEFLIGFGLREFVQLALESPKKAYAFVLNRVAEKINWENGEFDYIKSMDVCESLNKALNVIHEKKVKEVEALASKALSDVKKAFELKKIAGILFNIYLKKNPPSNSISHYNMPNYCYGDESYQ